MRIQKWMDKNVEGSTVCGKSTVGTTIAGNVWVLDLFPWKSTPSTAERREQERGGCFIQIRRNVPKESGNCGGFKRGAGETGRHHLEVPLRWARVGPTGPVYCQQRIPAKNLSGKLPNLATHSRLISILSLWRPSAVTEQVHGGPGAEATLGWPPTGILSASLFGNVSTRLCTDGGAATSKESFMGSYEVCLGGSKKISPQKVAKGGACQGGGDGGSGDAPRGTAPG
ncbi:uncharacterized protein LOC133472897 isoform X3 [Phyllopteryx taeniolatus]|uniref:uncharacterized protein LOC133472897 isoform X3 n=1 Tax=Phyllopteryx taeniolatus TaxID=161469 RepID=UPI002AD3287A|nr:uncharacterized protein LOC133472897 isoform X3 [Phyllopteryx taeniolatus]